MDARPTNTNPHALKGANTLRQQNLYPASTLPAHSQTLTHASITTPNALTVRTKHIGKRELIPPLPSRR
jgi:hypothetical protein